MLAVWFPKSQPSRHSQIMTDSNRVFRSLSILRLNLVNFFHFGRTKWFFSVSSAKTHTKNKFVYYLVLNEKRQNFVDRNRISRNINTSCCTFDKSCWLLTQHGWSIHSFGVRRPSFKIRRQRKPMKIYLSVEWHCEKCRCGCFHATYICNIVIGASRRKWISTSTSPTVASTHSPFATIPSLPTRLLHSNFSD